MIVWVREVLKSLEMTDILNTFHRGHPLESCEESYFASFSDLWNVYGECENFAVLKGHTGAVMELHFSLDGR